MSVTDALLQWRSREVFPTDLSSVDLRGLSSELRLRSVFSARVTNAEFLQEVSTVVDDMLAGKIDIATGRWQLMKKLKVLGYDPMTGFPDDMANIPPAEVGSLKDLSSERRLNLILDTNMRVAANYGRMVAGNTEYARRWYPAWKLIRVYTREHPRGSVDSHSAGWELRWHDAGEAVAWEGAVESPMIALKDSPIWQALGDGSGGYTDTLNNPFPPFAFNSGLGWTAVSRADCVMLGLINGEEISGKMDGSMTPSPKELKNAFDRLNPDLRKALEESWAA